VGPGRLSKALLTFFFFLRKGLTVWPRLAWNLGSFCLSPECCSHSRVLPHSA
jgi:hypothetical protein